VHQIIIPACSRQNHMIEMRFLKTNYLAKTRGTLVQYIVELPKEG
jgi:hypothetical protein